MDHYLPGVTDHLIVLIYIGRAEVDQDVDDEHDIHNEVNDRQRVAVAALDALIGRVFLLLAQDKRGRVRGENGRVDHQEENYPIPDCL